MTKCRRDVILKKITGGKTFNMGSNGTRRKEAEGIKRSRDGRIQRGTENPGVIKKKWENLWWSPL